MFSKISKKISIYVVHSKKLSTIVFKWWSMWSNFYQFIERKFTRTLPELLKTWNEYKIKSETNDAVKDWTTYCDEHLKVFHYGSDGFFQLFDVISLPSRFAYRKGGDCDDFSRLSYNFFGKYINNDGILYEFDGLRSILWENGNGHCIAVWRSLQNDFINYFVVSNNKVILVDNINKYFNYWFEDSKNYIVRVGRFIINDETKKIKFEKLLK